MISSYYMNAFWKFGSVVSLNKVKDYTYMMPVQLIIRIEK